MKSVRLIAALSLCALYLGVAGEMPAQSTTAAKSTSVKGRERRGGIITGLVSDSLHDRPLAHAEVLVEGKAIAIEHTDEAGEFRTKALPSGKYRVSISHPFLDSLGISLHSPEFFVVNDSTTRLKLSVPSSSSLIKIVCGGMSTTNPGSAVIGQVLASDSQDPLARAEMTLTWIAYSASVTGAVDGTVHIARDTTRANGRYAFCGLPNDLKARLEARVRGELRSISTVVIADTTSTVGVYNVVLAGTPVREQNTGSISGRVELPNGQPAQRSFVELAGMGKRATTDEKGRFTLDSVQTGPAVIRARLLGYQPDSVSLTVTPAMGQGLVVKLKSSVPVLKTVTVSTTARAEALDHVGFTQRSLHSVGHFLTAEQLARKSDFQFTDLLRGIPGLTVGIDKYGQDVVTSSRAGGSILNSTHSCVQYFVDGQPWGNAALESMGMPRPQDSAANKMLAQIAIETARQINAVLKKSDVLGIEVYQGGGAPAYFNQGGHNCATIVIWTVASLTR